MSVRYLVFNLYTSSKSRVGKFIDDIELGKELGIQAMSMRRVHMYLNVMRSPKYDDANFSSYRSIQAYI
ncbi:hypothetical protein Bandiella_00509 [Candidatus Bandiella woodruffii]|uniref:Uncharacterized protein n=1 Tax=Candidatus Bandiella euplotis TaxID=1664265 RepID=A0ABZ0UL37_9RICK|nr:hypothetical protein Bandiella_00509 [Candidatus Bandiella woodruffii]